MGRGYTERLNKSVNIQMYVWLVSEPLYNIQCYVPAEAKVKMFTHIVTRRCYANLQTEIDTTFESSCHILYLVSYSYTSREE